MKKFTTILEQRIYLFYFLLSLILVLIIISVEWQLVKYGIKMAENQKIYSVFNSYLTEVKKSYSENKELLSLIADYIQKNKGMSAENIRYIVNLIAKEKSENIIVISKEDSTVYGENWDLISKYLNPIKSDKNISGYILSKYGIKTYLIVYHKIVNDSNENIGTIIFVQKVKFSIPYIANMHYQILPYPLKESMFEHLSRQNFDKIIKGIEKNISKRSRFVIRPSYSLAVGVVANKIYNNLTTSFFLVFYTRNINVFAQRSIWFFILILVAVTLLMIAIFGNWFRSAVLHPVKVLSDTMKKNTQEPDKLEKINLNYGGVLGDMVNSFNQMEEALERYSNYLLEYKIATENIENGVFWLDENFKIIMYNKSFLKIFNEKEEIKGKSFLDYVHLTEEDKNKIKSGYLSLKNYEYAKGNLIKHLNINFRLVKEKGKRVIVGGITDITPITLEKEAREKLEMELIKTNKLAEIGRRVEGIVHNMNSPLNSIIGYAQLMKKEIGENEDLEKILKSGKLIAHYIKTLQQKIKNDNVSMYRLIDVNKLLKDELELFKNNLFFKHHVKTITSFEKKLPKINAVYGDVSMCITNIINNALDAMKNSEEKILRISTSTTKDNFIKITIQDTGCGIEKKDLPHIFEPYYSTKSYPQGSGYGLGLAIARYIVDKYKGKILVKSEVNKGTDFTILFPVGK
jgi:PAS domain S-box-containing protein